MGAFGVAQDVFYAREIGLAYKISAGSDIFLFCFPLVYCALRAGLKISLKKVAKKFGGSAGKA